MKELEVTSIRHFKVTQGTNCSLTEFKHSVVLPTHVPDTKVHVIDITKLCNAERDRLFLQMKEYMKYVKNHLNRLFSFENWAEHTGENVPTNYTREMLDLSEIIELHE